MDACTLPTKLASFLAYNKDNDNNKHYWLLYKQFNKWIYVRDFLSIFSCLVHTCTRCGVVRFRVKTANRTACAV